MSAVDQKSVLKLSLDNYIDSIDLSKGFTSYLFYGIIMANFSRVAEIFEQASVAFGRLAQLTIDLKQFQAQQNDGDSKTCGKWSQKEIDDLKAAISRFGADLSKIAEAVETKTINQIKQKLKTRGGYTSETGNYSTEHCLSNFICVAYKQFQVDRGRRKQALNQITESVDVRHPPKVSLDFIFLYKYSVRVSYCISQTNSRVNITGIFVSDLMGALIL
ncbi:unnamed protein product [Trichobilharzia regenti]|nr:unnamed protein product [Trichobilharzia regenti]